VAEAPLNELMQALAAVPEGRASFTEQKTLAALSAPVVTHGRLAYRRPDYLEKVTYPPNQETLVVNGSHLTFAMAEETPHALDLDQEPAIRALVDAMRGTLAGDLPALQRGYTITMDGDLAAWRLTLVPREATVAQLLRQVVIAGSGAALHAVDSVQPNGDTAEMTIEPDR
jgi:hypothetical protein